MAVPQKSPYKSAEIHYRRRSLWGRLAHRPWLLASALLLLLPVGYGTYRLGYQLLSYAELLPRQVHEKASVAALEELLTLPEFDRLVIPAIQRRLENTWLLRSEVAAFADYLQHSGLVETVDAPYVSRPRTDPSPEIARWRDLVEELRRRGIRVYAYTADINERSAWLRTHLADQVQNLEALAAHDSKPKLQPPGIAPERLAQLKVLAGARQEGVSSAARVATLEDAGRRVARTLGISKQELDALLFLEDQIRNFRSLRR